MKQTRVLLVDDHALVRAGLCSLVKETGWATVVGEAGNGQEALQLVNELRPDVVVMDLAMGDMNGLEATRLLIKESPGIRVLILSMHANDEYVRHAFQAGAAGYLLKRAAGQELANALKQVAAGSRYFNSQVEARPPTPSSLNWGKGEDPLAPLTPRQREILRMLAESRTTKEIAGLLQVSTKTVEFHRAQLMDRLQIFDIPALVRFAVRVGLVLPET